eukprot:1156127-Pelagomonas_calceolata.AAC.3
MYAKFGVSVESWQDVPCATWSGVLTLTPENITSWRASYAALEPWLTTQMERNSEDLKVWYRGLVTGHSASAQLPLLAEIAMQPYLR